jgi:hypothetical protein
VSDPGGDPSRSTGQPVAQVRIREVLIITVTGLACGFVAFSIMSALDAPAGIAFAAWGVAVTAGTYLMLRWLINRQLSQSDTRSPEPPT